jgi:hypothetical protein
MSGFYKTYTNIIGQQTILNGKFLTLNYNDFPD